MRQGERQIFLSDPADGHGLLHVGVQAAGDRAVMREQLERVLEAQGLRAPPDRQPAAPRLCSTDEGRHMRQLASTLLGLDAPVEKVSITTHGTSPGCSYVA